MAAEQRLTGAGGRVLARYERRRADDGRPFADLLTLEPGVEPAEAIPAVLAAFRGWRVGADPAFGRELVLAGARAWRHSHVMSRDLRRDPAPAEWLQPSLPGGFRLAPAARPAAELAAACAAAYPPGHPDHHGGGSEDEDELEGLLSGRLLGPLLPCSALAVGPGDRVAGAVLVNDTGGEPPLGGPWISQLFRAPDAPGLGVPLLRHALAAATRDGLATIGLAVTNANPARARYAAHGFAEVLESLSVDVL